MPDEQLPPGRRVELPTDRQLFQAWLIRAVLGGLVFGLASVYARGDELSLRNVVGYGLLFGVLVATLHFLASLYARSKARRARDR